MNKIINEMLKINNCDGLLLANTHNRRWFTGFNSSFGYVLINKEKSIFITDSRYFLAAKNEIKKSNLKIWCITANKSEDLISLLEKAKKLLGVKRVLIEGDYTTISDFKIINKIWSDSAIRSFDSKILREVKSNSEIRDLQKAANIIIKTMRWIWEFIKPGMTEIDIARLISIKIISLGGEKNSFDPIVAAGKNGANPHHKPSKYALKDGDMVTIDLGCYYNGYASDMTRTFVLGKKCNNEEMLEIYKLVYKAQTSTLKKAKNNITGVELDGYCRSIIDETKYNGLFSHGTGHGVGLEVHEFPNVNQRNNKKFVNGNVITIEPGIYKKNVGGVRIEDTIVINNSSPIVLTANCPKTLQFIDWSSRKKKKKS